MFDHCLDSHMASSSVPTSIQNRRSKRVKASTQSPSPTTDIDSAVDLLVNDASLPPHLRVVVCHLLEMKKEYTSILSRNQDLVEEMKMVRLRNEELQKENSNLHSEIVALKSQLSSKDSASAKSLDVASPNLSYDEIERKRSIVVSGAPESFAAVPSLRVVHDFGIVREMFDFLQIDSYPVSVFRMGRIIAGRPRLLKVVLPSSFYANLVIRRAPRLRTFSLKGIYVRPSLTKSERDRIRNARMSSYAHNNVADNVLSVPVLSQECSLNVLQSSQTSLAGTPHQGNE